MPVVLSGIGLVILWYIFVALAEVTSTSLFPNIESFFESFLYLVLDWWIEAIVTLLIVHFLIKRSNTVGLKSLFESDGNAIIILILSFFAGALAYFINDVILNVSKEFLPENYPAQEVVKLLEQFKMEHQKLVFYSLLTVITPMSEEILFRGFCYKMLRNECSVFISAFITSIIFIIWHPVAAWIPHLLLTNFFSCYLYEKTNFIGAPIALHAGINFFAIVFSTFI